jgi:hypothetical protein
VAELDALNPELVIVSVDEALARRASELADERGLRGYDAVHLASALALGPAETILVTWDRDLSNAAVGVGLAVAPALWSRDRRDSDRLGRGGKGREAGGAVSIDAGSSVLPGEQPLVRSWRLISSVCKDFRRLARSGGVRVFLHVAVVCGPLAFSSRCTAVSHDACSVLAADRAQELLRSSTSVGVSTLLGFRRRRRQGCLAPAWCGS